MPNSLLTRAAQGAAAGALGTLALQLLVMAQQKFLPEFEPPESEDPASFILWQAEKHLPQKTWLAIPPQAETAAGFGLSFLYGAKFGALYGALRPNKSCTLRDGLALGAAVWAVGYLGWLPACGLTPPLWKQSATQVIGPLIEHATYGLITVAAYELIKNHWQ